jgi:BirA family transcriptional regulator, biotin operon repressor / biotin---[acetyl-CoA-carboxylase] ligase
VSGTPPGPPAAQNSHPALGWPRVHLRHTDSTNDRARALALAGAPHGTLVTAAEQDAGRGRQGRRWSAPAGSSLLMSLLVRDPPLLLPLIAAVAVCDAVDATSPSGHSALIKWPNDIVRAHGERLSKLAGILIEGRFQQGWAVLGIGLNVAVRLDDLPPELAPGGPRPAATLGLTPDHVEPALAALLRALALRLDEPGERTLAAWSARDALRGREIHWEQGHGRAQGIDGTGRLIVALDAGGQTSIGAGEVHLRALGDRPG